MKVLDPDTDIQVEDDVWEAYKHELLKYRREGKSFGYSAMLVVEMNTLRPESGVDVLPEEVKALKENIQDLRAKQTPTQLFSWGIARSVADLNFLEAREQKKDYPKPPPQKKF